MRLNLILAASANGVIGAKGGLPWHLPEDLAHFKAMTAGCPVIMGRKTWDSLPAAVRPLPGRLNLVVTRQGNWSAEGALSFLSLEAAIQACQYLKGDAGDVWVIGGAQLYELALPLAQRIELTSVDVVVEGDAFAPVLGPEWALSSDTAHTSKTGLRYNLRTLLRKA